MFAKRIIFSLAAAALAGLILTGSGSVHAQTAPAAPARGLVGEVRDLYAGSFTLIQNGTGEEFILFLQDFDANAALTTPSSGPAQFRNGAQVAVLVDDEFTAVQILVKPSRPSILPFSGAVTSVENGMLTVFRPNGETMTVRVPSGERAPRAGAVVMGFARASDSRGAPPVTTGLTTAAEMRSRLEGFLEKASNVPNPRSEQTGPNPRTGQAGASPRSEQRGTSAQERSARLAKILADHTARQVAILQGVLDLDKDNLSDKARDAVTRAHSTASVGLQRAMEVAVLARAAVRDMGVRGEQEAVPGRVSAQTNSGS